MTRPAISGLFSSLLVLAGVFFFINAACFSSSPDVDTVYCNSRPSTPEGATITLVEPQDGAMITDPASGSFVKVPFRISTTRVTAEVPRCELGNGHFEITATSSPTGRCPAPPPQVFSSLFSNEGTIELTPGGYTLLVTFVDGQGQPYVPALTATAHVTVIGQTGAAGGPACPP